MKNITTLLTTLVAAAAVSTGNAALILHYTFDSADISGTTVTDFGTGGNDGTIDNTVTTQTGKFGDALLFGSSAAHAVDVGTALLSTTDAFQAYSMSYWVKSDPSATVGTGVSQYATSTPGRFGTLNNSGTGEARWFKNGATDFIGTTDTLDEAWHHIVFVKNADQTVNLFVDMVDETPGTTPVDNAAFLNANTLIGTLRYTSPGDLNRFEGLIDEVHIYDEALNQSEINSLFSSNTINAVPEPSSALLGLTSLGLALLRRR